MKTKITFFIFCLMLAAVPLRAQTEVATYLKNGPDDAAKLITAFMNPLSKVVESDLNASWFETAAVKKWGVGIGIHVSAALVPEHDRTFDISALGLSTSARLKDVNNKIAPNVAGENLAGPTLQYVMRNPTTQANQVLAEYRSPKGSGFPTFPIPAISLSLGLPLGLELTGRYLPSFTYENVSMTSWGAGAKFNFTKLIPGVQKISFINAALFAGISGVSSQSNLDLEKTEYNDFHNFIIPGGQADYTDQTMDIEASGIVAGLLASVDLSSFTVYGSIGFAKSSSSLKLNGTYPTISNSTGSLRIVDVTNPVAIDFDGFSGPVYRGGVRLKMGPIALKADVAAGNYTSASLGLMLLFNQK